MKYIPIIVILLLTNCIKHEPSPKEDSKSPPSKDGSSDSTLTESFITTENTGGNNDGSANSDNSTLSDSSDSMLAESLIITATPDANKTLTPPFELCCTFNSDTFYNQVLGHRPASIEDTLREYPHAFDSLIGWTCGFDNFVTEPCYLHTTSSPNTLDAKLDTTDSSIDSSLSLYGDWWYEGIRCDTPNEWGHGTIGTECFLKDIGCFGVITTCDPCQVYGMSCPSRH